MLGALVITCPSDKQCSRSIPLVYDQRRFQLRLAAHSQQFVDRLRIQYPDAEVVMSDLQLSSDCRILLHRATAINAVLPVLHSREKDIGINLVHAAVAESIREGNQCLQAFCFLQRSLYSTQVSPTTRPQKLRRRKFVPKSLICPTILRPTIVSLKNTSLITVDKYSHITFTVHEHLSGS